ncbi:MAG: CRISPR-associated endonuclease Cas2 [Dialister pneumosintes]
MRVLVLFDLPVETIADRRAYTQFRKFLIRNGFIMMQESVYSKIVQNVPAAQAVMGHFVRIEAPKHGLIQMMMITEKQYANMELVIGHVQEEVVDSDDRLVIV